MYYIHFPPIKISPYPPSCRSHSSSHTSVRNKKSCALNVSTFSQTKLKSTCRGLSLLPSCYPCFCDHSHIQRDTYTLDPSSPKDLEGSSSSLLHHQSLAPSLIFSINIYKWSDFQKTTILILHLPLAVDTFLYSPLKSCLLNIFS